jgi:hypothetical protein
MSAWINALGAMLQTGGAIGMKRQQDAQDEETRRLADAAKEARDKAKKKDEAPSHFNTKRTGPGGATIEEVNEQRWNPETESYESKVISAYDLPAKEKRAETAIEYAQRDPAGYAKMHELERGPAKPSTPKEPKDTSAADAKDLNKSVDSAMNTLRGMDAEERAAELSSYGIDPAAGDARAKYENVIRSELTRRFSGQPAGEAQPAYMKLPDEKKYAGFDQENLQKNLKPGSNEFAAAMAELSTPEKAPAAPAAPGTKPAPAPYPEGTKLVKDGKTYIVKNGEPVPYGG